MNILFFSRLFYPHIGGVEKHVLEISKILIKKGHKIVVVAEKHKNVLDPREKIKDIEIYRMPNLKENWFKKFRIWKWMWENKELIQKADIIHCHDVFFWYLPFRFFFRKPVYTTFHGYENYPLKRRQIIMRKISEWLSVGSICVGDFMKKWYGTKPDYVTYGAVEVSNVIHSTSSGQISNKIKNKSAIFIGRLDEQTGIKTYVSAVRLIRNKIPDFDFTVIGDGSLRREIERDFKVLGFRKDTQKYLRQYHFAFVSRFLSILEALAAKRLVFAVYDNPLKEDYLKMTPFVRFINVLNSETDLAREVIYFLKNPKEETKIVNKAFDWVKTNNWEKVTKLYLILWERTFPKRDKYISTNYQKS